MGHNKREFDPQDPFRGLKDHDIEGRHEALAKQVEHAQSLVEKLARDGVKVPDAILPSIQMDELLGYIFGDSPTARLDYEAKVGARYLEELAKGIVQVNQQKLAGGLPSAHQPGLHLPHGMN